MNIVTFETADEKFKEDFDTHKISKSISIGKKLHNAYRDFCYIVMKRQDMSVRIRINMVRDMMENETPIG